MEYNIKIEIKEDNKICIDSAAKLYAKKFMKVEEGYTRMHVRPKPKWLFKSFYEYILSKIIYTVVFSIPPNYKK